MPELGRCPVCDVPVKPENLARHLQSIHPRDASAREAADRIQRDVRYAPKARASRGLRLRTTHIAAIAVVPLLVVAAIVVAPYFDPYRNLTADTCLSSTQPTPYHIHVQLSVFVNAVREPIPYNTGNTPTCTKVVHTHDSDYDASTGPAVIHVEAPVARTFFLGDFFRIWGVVITETQVLQCQASSLSPVTMVVNGVESRAFGSLVLADGQDIGIACGGAI